jgi:hypothetical protein
MQKILTINAFNSMLRSPSQRKAGMHVDGKMEGTSARNICCGLSEENYSF